MIQLVTTPNLETPDASYARLIAAHDGLDDASSHALNARLVLILMNQVGRADLIDQAIATAQATAPAGT